MTSLAKLAGSNAFADQGLLSTTATFQHAWLVRFVAGPTGDEATVVIPWQTCSDLFCPLLHVVKYFVLGYHQMIDATGCRYTEAAAGMGFVAVTSNT